MDDDDKKNRIDKRFEILKISKRLYGNRESIERIKENSKFIYPQLYNELVSVTNATDFIRVLEKHQVFKVTMKLDEIQMNIDKLAATDKTIKVVEEENNPIVPAKSTINQCPTINDDDVILDELSKSCGAKWEFIGIFIGLDYSDVERLSANNENCEDKLLQIFKEKIGTEEGLTWPMICRALSYLKFNRHIKEIEDNPSYKHLISGSYELPRPNWLFFMAYVSFRISSFWEKLGRQLKVQEIDAIKSDNVRYRGIESKAFAVLRAKYDSEDGLNWTMLANALKDCGRSDVFRNINKIQEFKHLL